ncbi:radical SAM/SPASM domain-containing protein [Clostridioides difficile]
MNAKIRPGYSPDRRMLGEILPLKSPFTIFINPTTVCNFKCSYCTHSKSEDELSKLNFIQKHMDYDVFLEVVEQLEKFNEKFKLIYIFGNGEPLCNPRLGEMIAHINEKNITDRIEFFTNGALLTKEKSLELINSGLTQLKISVQALSSEGYKKICGVNLDYDKFIDQIKFFYENKKNCKLYIKIIDLGLSQKDKETFYKTFENISDEMFIEHITYTQKTMGDYDGMIKEELDLYGDPLTYRDACTFPFYVLRVGVDGEINPCFEKVFGNRMNINNTSIYDYWNSEELKQFRIMHLKKMREKHEFCSTCKCQGSTSRPEDNIDSYALDILKRMGEK